MAQLQQILIRCLYFLLYPLSFLFIRNKKKWVFGNYNEVFADNSKFLFIYVKHNYKDIRPIWITPNAYTYRYVKQLGFEVYSKNTLVGIYHCLTAKMYFFNGYASDINFFTSGRAVLINLWHGVGLKKIEFSLEGRMQVYKNFYLRLQAIFRFPAIYKRPAYLISSTNFQSIPFAKAFRIPLERCLNTGYPRNDFLLMEAAEQLQFVEENEAPEILGIINHVKRFDKVYIYMPTWRRTTNGFFNYCQIDFSKVNDLLASTNSVLLLKLHPILDEQLPPFSNIVLLQYDVDPYCLMPFTDTLITDYSSVLYDYILMPGKQVVLYLFDYKNYIDSGSFNYPFLENVTGTIITDVNQLYSVFQNELPHNSVNDVDTIRERFWGDYNGQASKKIAEIVYKEYVD